jgi:hypothetical protein
MRVVACRHHDDGNVAGTAQGAAQFESIYARKHDVNQDDVGFATIEHGNRLFTALGFVDGPPLVFEREFDGRSDAFVVFDGQDACSHVLILA